MTDNKTPDAGTKEHLKKVDEQYADKTEEATDRKKTETESAYEARAAAYSAGQEEIAAKLKEQAAPYEKLSNLVDEHSTAEKEETTEAAPKKK